MYIHVHVKQLNILYYIRSVMYLALENLEESKQYTVINTHRGLFRYNRLPSGILRLFTDLAFD